jgi:hypothetical protein
MEYNQQKQSVPARVPKLSVKPHNCAVNVAAQRTAFPMKNDKRELEYVVVALLTCVVQAHEHAFHIVAMPDLFWK